MAIIAQVGSALQQVFGEIAMLASQASGVIQRERKFDACSLLKTFVLGFLQKPDASDEDLAQMAAQCGADVTPQAIDQRHTRALVAFLEAAFRDSVKLVVGSHETLAPILERFTNVTLLDSSTITLPDEMHAQFAGCGGSYGSGAAAMKLQTEFDLRSGALSHVEIEPGRSPDGAASRQQTRRRRRFLADIRPGVFQRSGVRRDDGCEGIFSLASAVRHDRASPGWPGGEIAVLVGETAGTARRSADSAGQSTASGVSADRLATACRASQPAAAKAASGNAPQTRARTECGTLGVVRLDDSGDQRAAGHAGVAGGRGSVPRAVAN